MKTITSFLLLLFFTSGAYSQVTDTLRVKIFSFTPVSNKIDKVNGLALGIGHMWSPLLNKKEQDVKVNGLNLEVNPLTPLFILFLDPNKVDNSPITTINGLHVSTAGFIGGSKINGINLSIYNVGIAANGLGVTGLYNVTGKLNGLHIAGINNTADEANGFLISFSNSADIFKGVQIGAINISDVSMKGLQLGGYNGAGNMTGVQIGICNKAKKVKGLQIGLWNINEKRSLPFFNF